jgi:hypothetical protein
MEGRCYCLDTYRAGDMDGAADVNVVSCARLKAFVGGTDGLRYHANIPLKIREIHETLARGLSEIALRVETPDALLWDGFHLP